MGRFSRLGVINLRRGGESSPALDFVDAASDGADSGTAISVTHGLSIQAGDLVMAEVHVNGSTTIADNNGSYPFTEADEDYFNSEDRAVYWRIAGSSEPSSYAWTASASNRWAVVVFVLRPPSGLSVQSPPFDVSPATVSTGTGTTVTAAAQTAGENNCAVVAVAYTDGASTFTAGPSGWTEAETIETNQPISVYYKTDQSSGSTGTADWTIDASNDWGANIYTLKKAA